MRRTRQLVQLRSNDMEFFQGFGGAPLHHKLEYAPVKQPGPDLTCPEKLGSLLTREHGETNDGQHPLDAPGVKQAYRSGVQRPGHRRLRLLSAVIAAVTAQPVHLAAAERRVVVIIIVRVHVELAAIVRVVHRPHALGAPVPDEYFAARGKNKTSKASA